MNIVYHKQQLSPFCNFKISFQKQQWFHFANRYTSIISIRTTEAVIFSYSRKLVTEARLARRALTCFAPNMVNVVGHRIMLFLLPLPNLYYFTVEETSTDNGTTRNDSILDIITNFK